MRKVFRKSVWAAFVFLLPLFAGGCAAGLVVLNPTGVEGTAWFDSSSVPLEGARVGVDYFTALTSPKGYFQINGLTPGEKTVEVRPLYGLARTSVTVIDGKLTSVGDVDVQVPTGFDAYEFIQISHASEGGTRRWKDRRITYFLDTSQGASPSMISAAKSAFQKYQNCLGWDFSLVEESSSAEADIVVTWVPASDPRLAGADGRTTTSYSCGYINKANVFISLAKGSNMAILLHEIGHAMGFAHVSPSSAYANYVMESTPYAGLTDLAGAEKTYLQCLYSIPVGVTSGYVSGIRSIDRLDNARALRTLTVGIPATGTSVE